ncbi:MAG TPA: hypothetical protein VF483_09950 [Gemmatimonadaceae bacterium]
MNLRQWISVVGLALCGAAAVSACHTTYAVVPRPSGGYRPDTLRAYENGKEVFVIFRFDTIAHTQYIRVTDTLWRDGVHIIHDTLRIFRRDTIRVVRRDTVRIIRHDTVSLVGYAAVQPKDNRPPPRDTVRIVRVDTVRIPRTDTVRVTVGGNVTRVDTVRVPVEVVRTITRVDTVRRTDSVIVQLPPQTVTHTDTIRLTRVDTVRIASNGNGASGSARTLFVPPGQYPPEGQCRVWIQGMPPGQQRRPSSCEALGDIPAGAFILFGGVAWDFDFDWVSAPAGSAPPQIVAVKRSHPRKP